MEIHKEKLGNLMMPFQYINIRKKLCFPNKKIAIYDSGKLNMMMELLKKLKDESHKVIIFTQMSKMLDIFEFGLNTYNFTYVRLDGSTKVFIFFKKCDFFNFLLKKLHFYKILSFLQKIAFFA